MPRNTWLDTALAAGVVAIVLYAGFALVLEPSGRSRPTTALVTDQYEGWGRYSREMNVIRLEDGRTYKISGNRDPGVRLCIRVKEGRISGRRTPVVQPNHVCGKPGVMAEGW